MQQKENENPSSQISKAPALGLRSTKGHDPDAGISKVENQKGPSKEKISKKRNFQKLSENDHLANGTTDLK